MLFKGRSVGAFVVAAVCVISGCDNGSNNNSQNSSPVEPAGELPSNINEWVCETDPAPPSAEEIASWCADTAPHGMPLPEALRTPPSMQDLTAKNQYDEDLKAFLRAKRYQTELNWASDKQWRLTGPYVGDIGSGGNYGSHPGVKVYYSPEVVDWMCGDRSAPLPDGAMVIKSMHSIDEDLGIELENNACMTITDDPDPGSWTVIVKNSAATTDGWYWGFYSASTADDQGNPPLMGLAAVTSEFALQTLEESTTRDPRFYPTPDGTSTGTSEADMAQASVVFANAGYGAYCINCHASAARESTFSSLNNVLTNGVRYRQFTSSADQDKVDLLALPAFVGRHHGIDEEASPENPFPVPRATPSDIFLDFYNQLSPVTYPQAMALSMPSETYDHAVAGNTENPHGSTKFVTSDQCAGCHDAAAQTAAIPNMIFFDESGDEPKALNLSPYAEWRASPMGLAGRDPIFFAQLESETNHLQQHSTCIEQTCMRCHGVMGSRQLAIDTPGQGEDDCEALYPVAPPAGVPFGKEFTRDIVQQWPHSETHDEQNYGALGRDGISCTVCHRVSPEGLGDEETFTGNFVTGPDSELYGPYTDDTIVTKPMENSVGITPIYGAQLATSEMCGSCHNILLPTFNNEGTVVGGSYEQSTHLEWLNSDFGPGGSDFKSCNDCHMTTEYKGEQLHSKIASIETNNSSPTTERLPDAEITLTERSKYARHQLHGLNVFLNQMFQQFPLILGIRQVDYLTSPGVTPPLLTGMNSMMEMAREGTAEVELTSVERMLGNKVRAQVKVINKTGHDLPSGVGFRRVFLEFVIRDTADNIIWASGRTNALGAIVDGVTEEVLDFETPAKFAEPVYQPHYQSITRGDQVQVYQEVISDSDNKITTSFLRRINYLKNNRIKPRGYDPEVFLVSDSDYIRELAFSHGEASNDPYYSDPTLTGADTIEYIATLTPAQMADLGSVEVNLYNQSIPPSYLQERFNDASVGPMEMDDIQRLYYLTSHLNTDAVNTEYGEDVIESWKLRLASDQQSIAQ